MLIMLRCRNYFDINKVIREESRLSYNIFLRGIKKYLRTHPNEVHLNKAPSSPISEKNI